MKVLKDWAQADRDAFERLHDRRGCTCFISAPCSCCTHPGHPFNQDECEDCWEEVFDLDEACEKAMERVRQHIEASAHGHMVENTRLGSAISEVMYVRHRHLIMLEDSAYKAWKTFSDERERRWLMSHGVVL